MTCEFAHDDGAYVLGALSPAERQRFEQHLATCDECSRSVRMLAGLPGLLARVDANLLEDPPDAEPPPATLLPTLVREVRRTRTRRTLLATGIAAAAAAVVVTGSLAVSGVLGSDGSPSAAPPAVTPTGQAMRPVGEERVRSSLAFESVAWGTRLDLTCTLPRPRPRLPAALAVLRAGGAHPQRSHRAGRHLALAARPDDAAHRRHRRPPRRHHLGRDAHR